MIVYYLIVTYKMKSFMKSILILIFILYISLVAFSRLVFAAHYTNHLVTGLSLGYLNFSIFLYLFNSSFCDIIFNTFDKKLVYVWYKK